MVGTNPFDEGSGETNVATQVVPIVIKTHTVGTTLGAKGIIATAPGNTTFNATRSDRTCLESRNNNPLKVFLQSPLLQPADFNCRRHRRGHYAGDRCVPTSQFLKGYRSRELPCDAEPSHLFRSDCD
jgi:hypothetical protein